MGQERTITREQDSRKWLPLPHSQKGFLSHSPIRDKSHLIDPDHEGGETMGKLQICGNSTVRMQGSGRVTSTNALQQNLNDLSHHCKTHGHTQTHL